jgi:hypothetical protein
MPRRAARFTQADVNRATKAAQAAGMAVELLPDGIIRLIPIRTGETAAPAPVSAFDEWKARQNANSSQGN